MATQDALEPVAQGLYVEVVRVSRSISVDMHFGGERLAPVVEYMHCLLGVLLWLTCQDREALLDYTGLVML